MLKNISDFYLGFPSPGEFRWRVRAATFPLEIDDFGPIPARIRGVIYFSFYVGPKRSEANDERSLAGPLIIGSASARGVPFEGPRAARQVGPLKPI